MRVRSRHLWIENSEAGTAIRAVLQVSPMMAATEGVKRGGARGVRAPRDPRTRMTSRFFIIYGIYGAA